MQKFQADELRQFLLAVDRRLSEPFDLVVIGGSAVALAYGGSRTTRDIDTWDESYKRVESALEGARKETGLNIPLEHPGVEDAPHESESRLQVVDIPGLRNLAIKVPEKHDLVLMKMMRGEEPDLQAAEDIKASVGLDLDVLLTRYLEEMNHCVGDPRRLDLNFLVLVRRVYGERELELARKKLNSRGRSHR